MNKRPLAPRFLNKLDNRLLINRPDTWSTRFHLVVYYCLLFMVVLTAICFVVPMDHREKSFFGLWSGAAGVLSLIGCILWLVYLFRFNVFKQFGTVFPGDRLKTFLLYFVMIVLFSLVIYIPPVVECIRADRAYASEEMAKDINRINTLITELEYVNIPSEWTPDTLVMVARLSYETNSTVEETGIHYVDTNDFKSRIREADSVKWVRKDMAITYDFFNLVFVYQWRVAEHSATPINKTKELYYSAYLNSSTNRAQARNELQDLINKYRDPSEYGDSYYAEGENDNSASDIHEKYDLGHVGSGMNNIADRKYRLAYTDFSDIIRGTYYFALVLTLLIFVFRHSTIKTFFLSLLVGVIISILSGLVVAVLRLQEEGILYLLLFYFIVFAVLSMLIFPAKQRSLIYGIALNAFVLMTAFVPLVCVALYYSHEYYEQMFNPYDAVYYAQREQAFLLAEFAGAFVLLVLIETLFKRLYRKWYASPED